MNTASSDVSTQEVLVIRATPGKPIACDMTGASDTPQERLAEYGRLFAHALVGRERTAEAVALRFVLKPGVVDWITDLVRREAACCPFFSYQLIVDGRSVVWRTTSEAGEAAQAMLDEFYDLPDHCAEGIEAYFKRLGERGVAVSSPAKGQFTMVRTQPSSGRGLLAKLKSGCGC